MTGCCISGLRRWACLPAHEAPIPSGGRLGAALSALPDGRGVDQGALQDVHLDLENCVLGPRGMKEVVDAVAKSCGVTSISLRSTRIGPSGATLLAKTLSTQDPKEDIEPVAANADSSCADNRNGAATVCSIKELDLTSCGLGPGGVEAIAGALEGNSILTRLDLSWNGIKHPGAQHLCQSLARNTALLHLSLDYNGLKTDGACEVDTLLQHNTTLRSLSLRCCGLGKLGAKAIASGISNNHTLTRLEVSQNGIQAEGAKYFAVALERNSTLTRLNLLGNCILTEGAGLLENALDTNTTLGFLDLRDNKIDPQCMDRVAARLEQNRVSVPSTPVNPGTAFGFMCKRRDATPGRSASTPNDKTSPGRRVVSPQKVRPLSIASR